MKLLKPEIWEWTLYTPLKQLKPAQIKLLLMVNLVLMKIWVFAFYFTYDNTVFLINVAKYFDMHYNKNINDDAWDSIFWKICMH